MSNRLSRGILSFKSAVASPAPSKGLLTLDNAAGWLTGSDGSESPEMALKLSAVYRCVEVLAGTMGEMPVSVINWNTMEDQPRHYLSKVLWQRPNEAMTPSVYKAMMERRRVLRGNAYAYIHRDGNGRPVETIPLHPDLVSVNLDSRGRLWYGYADPNSGHSYALDPMQVLHYKNFSEDGLVGVSTLHHASRTIATANAREIYDQSVYVNGGTPAGVLKTDTDLTGTVDVPDGNGGTTKVTMRDYVRSEWERVHGGAANSFRVAVLDHGLDFKQLSVTNADAQFLESKDFSVFDVCRFFGVPPHKCYTGKQSYESNEANSIDFTADTMQPIVTQYEEEDKWKLLTSDEAAAGLVISRNMDVTLRSDTTARASWYKAMREIGAYNVDEIRRKERLPAVPGGKSRYGSLNYIPLELFEALSIERNRKGDDPHAD